MSPRECTIEEFKESDDFERELTPTAPSFFDDINSEGVKKVPIYRCLVVLGDAFQNYPLERKKLLKVSKSSVEFNIVKWIMKK